MKRGAVSAQATLDQPAHNQPSSRSLTQDKPRKATQLSTDQITNLEIDGVKWRVAVWMNKLKKKKRQQMEKKILIKKKRSWSHLKLQVGYSPEEAAVLFQYLQIREKKWLACFPQHLLTDCNSRCRWLAWKDQGAAQGVIPLSVQLLLEQNWLC